MDLRYDLPTKPRHYVFNDLVDVPDDEMDCGQVFWYKGDLYMHIQDVGCAYGGGSEIFRAVCLDDGTVWTFQDDAEITLVEGEYVVKNMKEFAETS